MSIQELYDRLVALFGSKFVLGQGRIMIRIHATNGGEGPYFKAREVPLIIDGQDVVMPSVCEIPPLTPADAPKPERFANVMTVPVNEFGFKCYDILASNHRKQCGKCQLTRLINSIEPAAGQF